jgi:hypothetical protein
MMWTYPPLQKIVPELCLGSKLHGGPLTTSALREPGECFRACRAARGLGDHEASVLSDGTYPGES